MAAARSVTIESYCHRVVRIYPATVHITLRDFVLCRGVAKIGRFSPPFHREFRIGRHPGATFRHIREEQRRFTDSILGESRQLTDRMVEIFERQGPFRALQTRGVVGRCPSFPDGRRRGLGSGRCPRQSTVEFHLYAVFTRKPDRALFVGRNGSDCSFNGRFYRLQRDYGRRVHFLFGHLDRSIGDLTREARGLIFRRLFGHLVVRNRGRRRRRLIGRGFRSRRVGYGLLDSRGRLSRRFTLGGPAVVRYRVDRRDLFRFDGCGFLGHHW